MTAIVLLTTFSILGLAFSLTKNGILQKVISAGLCISILVIWVADRNALLISLLLHIGLGITTFFYGLMEKKLKLIERISIGTTGLILSLSALFSIQYYMGQGVLRLALIIPISLFFWTTLKNGRKQSKEFGFMLTWTIIALEQIISYLTH